MKILLINLTRLGDLIQSQAAINDLTEFGHEVGLLCLDNFSAIAAMLENLNFQTTLDGASLLALTDAPAPTKTTAHRYGPAKWGKAVGELFLWRENIRKNFPYDMVCNLTSSTSARLLTSFLGHNTATRGFSLDSSGYMDNTNPWASFLEGTALSRNLSPLNIVDIFRGIATAEEPEYSKTTRNFGNAMLKQPPENTLKRIKTILTDNLPTECKGFIGLQLGASHEKRRWPVEYFVKTGQSLFQELGFYPVLLGSKNEEHLALEYRTLAKHPHLSLCGKTNIEELGAVLTQMSMLITNDTGTMHFAVGLQVPVLGIFLMTAQPFDTGPYQLDSCSLEPDLSCHPCPFGQPCTNKFECQYKILPQTVSSLAINFLSHKSWNTEHTEGSRIWLADHDSFGNIDLHPLNKQHSPRSAWLKILRHGLWHFFDANESAWDQQIFIDNDALPQNMRTAIAKELYMASQSLELFAQQGKMLAIRPLPPIKEKFLKNCEQVYSHLKNSQYLGILASVWTASTQQTQQPLQNILHAADNFNKLLNYFNTAVE